MSPLATPGVVHTPERPPGLSASIDRAVAAALSELPKGATGALLGVATERGGNLVLAHRIGDHMTAAYWIGKSGWSGPLEAGVIVKAVW